MKKKALVLAVGLAFATPTISVAKALPSNLVGLSLGEIQSQSYLNEPFRGIIPILFTDIEASKKLKVKLAPESIFQKVGAEKLPILNSLEFHIDVKNNKPIIYIESTQAVQMPFLNFVLEIEGPQGSIYQDYTTLLDPKRSRVNTFTENAKSLDQELQQPLQPPVSSSTTLLGTNRTLKVKSGDTLSQIAQALSAADVSLKKMVNAIHQRNPSAFINNNINRLKAGAVLHIPTKNELSNTSFKTAAKTALKNKPSNFSQLTSEEKLYTVKQGDSLSKITKKFGYKSVSFTKMMSAIHAANPHAFSKNSINLLKVGKTLKIPSIEEVMPKSTYSNNSSKIKNDPKRDTIERAEVDNTDNAPEFVLNGFVVEKGDTLAKITKQIGHEGVPYSEMMHAIYVANPYAFEKNNITTLIEGSIIRLPSIAEIKEMNSKELKLAPNKIKEESTKSKTIPIENKKSSVNTQSNNAVLLKLESRVRELKRDLNKAHSNLSNLELSLAGKEQLIKEQSKDLASLATTLELLNNNTSLDVSTHKKEDAQNTIPELSLLGTINSDAPSPSDPSKIDISNSPISPEAPNTDALIASPDSPIPPEFNQTLPADIKNKLAEYSQYMSGKELLSSILALLFGLALIRYRRKIYSYTNISYDYPKYYPPFGEEQARELLKGKSINFQDTLVDPMSNIHDEDKPTFSDTQIQECEALADELIEDLEIKTTIHNDSADWAELDRACDDYIEEYKENNVLEITDVSDNPIEGTESEPEEMTFELFEALAEGVTNKNANSDSKIVEDDTLIYGLNDEQVIDLDPFDEKQPMPFSELTALSEKADLEKAQAN